MAQSRILWINTGGTLVSRRYDDPFHPPEHVETLPIREADALIETLLKKLCREQQVDCYNYGIHWDYQAHGDTFIRDSKKFTDDYICDLAEVVESSSQKHFLITHGTDAMTENAARLKKELNARGITDKKIIFAGAMVPLSMQDLHAGDAEANISAALKELHEGDLPPGVYVAGRQKDGRIACVDPEGVTKDMAASRKDLQFTLKSR